MAKMDRGAWLTIAILLLLAVLVAIVCSDPEMTSQVLRLPPVP